MQEPQAPRARMVAGMLAALCLVAGPLAVMVARFASPLAKTTESVAREVGDAAAHPDRTHIVLLADGFIWLMVPAVLAAVWLAWRTAPALSLAACVLSVAGWIAIVSAATSDALIAQAAHHAYDRAQAVALAHDWSNGGLMSAYTTLFVVGHVVGTVLLGLALWRARVIPRWAAAFVGVSMPLHLVAFLTSTKPLDIAAFAMLLTGFGACAVRILQETTPHAAVEPMARPAAV
jgi:hypothetical protein